MGESEGRLELRLDSAGHIFHWLLPGRHGVPGASTRAAASGIIRLQPDERLSAVQFPIRPVRSMTMGMPIAFQSRVSVAASGTISSAQPSQAMGSERLIERAGGQGSNQDDHQERQPQARTHAVQLRCGALGWFGEKLLNACASMTKLDVISICG